MLYAVDRCHSEPNGWRSCGSPLTEVSIAGAPIAAAAADAAAAELQVPPLAVDEQQLCPSRVPTASWSLLRSLRFRGAVKRLDMPRNN
jgi:hypothetical protein